MNTTVSTHSLTVLKSFKQATLSIVNEKPHIALVKATGNYIPIEQFKKIFNEVGKLVVDRGITSLIFDKRQLTVFHQPSMEWYFIEWKEEMFDFGLIRHIKILPDDEVFKYSVRIGREKIDEDFPQGKYHLMDIHYADSIEMALNL